MAIRRIAQLGDPVVRATSSPVDLAQLHSDRLQLLIDDMIETMRDADGVGIAAPQVRVGQRIFAIEVRDLARYKNAELYPLTVVVNPTLTPLTEERPESWEGCLSVIGLRGRVPRFTSVRIDGYDRSGAQLSITVKGFPAIVAQHETDHLNGLVFLDRMTDMSSLTFEREWLRYHVADETAQSTK